MSDAAIIPSGGKDRWGGDLPPGEPVIVRGVVTYPRRSVENDQNSVITGITAIFPAGARIPEAIDSVLIGVQLDLAVDPPTLIPDTGKKYTVEGDPGEWTWLDSTPAGTEVALQKASG